MTLACDPERVWPGCRRKATLNQECGLSFLRIGDTVPRTTPCIDFKCFAILRIEGCLSGAPQTVLSVSANPPSFHRGVSKAKGHRLLRAPLRKVQFRQRPWREVPYTGKSLLRGNSLYREIPYKGKSSYTGKIPRRGKSPKAAQSWIGAGDGPCSCGSRGAGGGSSSWREAFRSQCLYHVLSHHFAVNDINLFVNKHINIHNLNMFLVCFLRGAKGVPRNGSRM